MLQRIQRCDGFAAAAQWMAGSLMDVVLQWSRVMHVLMCITVGITHPTLYRTTDVKMDSQTTLNPEPFQARTDAIARLE